MCLGSDIPAQDVRLYFPNAYRWGKDDRPFPHIDVFDSNGVLLGVCFFAEDVIDDTSGFGGPMSVLIGMDTLGNITRVKVVSSSETPFYAQRAFSEEFLLQFCGKSSSDDFKVGDDIDAVTGATVSSSALIRIVKEAVLYAFSKLKAELGR